MNTTPEHNIRFPSFFRHSAGYFLSRGMIILCFSLLIGIVVTLRPYLPGKWGVIALTTLAGLCLILMIGNLKKMLLAVIIIDIPLRWDIYLAARVQNAPLGMREGWIISLTTFALIGLFILHIIQELSIKKYPVKIYFRENIPLVLFMAFSCLSAITARDTLGALFQIFFLLQVFLLYIYIASITRSTQDVIFLMVILMGCVAVEGGISIAQRFFGLEINFAGIVTVQTSGRYAATLGSPNTAAGYFSLLLAPTLSLIFAKTSFLVKMTALAAFSLGLIGLVFTLSRGGLLAFGVSMAIFGIMIWLRGKISRWVAFPVVIAATGIFAFGGFTIDQIIGLRENAALARIPLMKIAWKMILEHPILGVGANNYVMNIRNYLVPELGRGFLYVVHNKYLLVWAETGLGGILSFIGFLVLAIRRGWQSWNRDIPILSFLSLGFAAAIAGQMTHMMVEIFDARSEIQALWLVAALITAMERLTRGEPSNAS